MSICIQQKKKSSRTQTYLTSSVGVYSVESSGDKEETDAPKRLTASVQSRLQPLDCNRPLFTELLSSGFNLAFFFSFSLLIMEI